MATNPNDTTQVRDAKARQTGKPGPDNYTHPLSQPGPMGHPGPDVGPGAHDPQGREAQRRDPSGKLPVQPAQPDPAFVKGHQESQADFDARIRTNPGRLEGEAQGDYEARLRAGRVQTAAMPAGAPAPRVITTMGDPAPKAVTLHLMDADERTVHDHVQVQIRPFVIEVQGNRYQQVREQPDGSWVYKHLPK